MNNNRIEYINWFNAMDGKSYRTTITNILPIKIVGEFIITEPIIKE
jgi:hypothetical protein